MQELTDGNLAAALFARDAHTGIEQQAGGGPFGGRVGQRQAAAKGASVADGGMGQVAAGLGQDRRRAANVRGGDHLRMARHGANHQLRALQADAGQVLQAVEVDQAL